jgi:hypothetical protein
MAFLPHGPNRKGFSTHNSVGTNNLSNPLLADVTIDGEVVKMQPGMIELKEADGTPHYLWVDSSSQLRLGSAVPTDPEANGTVIGP